MDRPQFVLIMFSGLVIILSVIRIYLLTELGVANTVLYQVIQEKERLAHQNMLLREAILIEVALSTIHRKAVEDGFIPAEGVYILR